MLDSIGPYQINSELGRGGMGVVYLARDTRLDRQVAIKALPAEVASDPARLERFEREARTLAGLSHPNIAGIHGVEEQDGARYLVLEYVDGESLADRLDRGPLPIDEAIEHAVQIAAGLEAAHDAGVIHRDLKPANVMITRDGQAKVLDFGLARTDEGGQSSIGGLDSPTMTTPKPQHSPTIEGAILGTAAYMSPEQARGRRVDKRTDIWSFGVVLYEMLVGTSPFHGETASDSIGAVLHKDLDLERLPRETPENVRRALRRCLERDKSLRYRDIGDVRIELLERDDAPAVASAAPSGARAATIVVSLALVAALAGAAAWWLKPSPAAEPDHAVYATTPLPKGIMPASWPEPTLSSDGRRLVIKVIGDNNTMLAVRDLGDPTVRIIPGSENGWNPVLSPGGDWLLYRAGDQLFKRLIAGGPPIGICDVLSMRGAVWENEDSIILAPQNVGPLHRVSARGGTPEPMYDIDPAAIISDRHPSVLPGGRGVMFHRCRGDGASWQSSRLMLLTPDSSAPRELLQGVPHARYVSTGHLVYQRQNSLFAAGFDLETLEFTTPETVVLEGLAIAFVSAPAMFDLTENGTLVYFEGSEQYERRRIVEVDFQGAVIPLTSHTDTYEEIVPSDDGRFIVTEINVVGQTDRVAVIELGRDLVSPVAKVNAAGDYGPVWSPDGRWVAFSSDRDESSGSRQLYRVRIGSASPAELVIATPAHVEATDWSSDGRSLIVDFDRHDGDGNIGVIRFDESGAVLSEDIEPLIGWPGYQWRGRLSPDGRWLLFTSQTADSGSRIFVASLDDPSRSTQVSVGDANHAAWSPDGGAVYYANDMIQPIAVQAVDFSVDDEGAPVISSPRHVVDLTTVNDLDSLYLNPDGTAFVVGEVVSDPEGLIDVAPRIVLNWGEELRRLVGNESR